MVRPCPTHRSSHITALLVDSPPSIARPRRPTFPAPPAQPPSDPAQDFALGFASVQEMHREVSLKVLGRLPSFLYGNLYRIGPGIFDVLHADGEKADKTHWFDGIGVVFKFHIDANANSISFMCRSVCPEATRAIRSTSKQEYKALSFGAAPPTRQSQSPLRKIRRFVQPYTRDPDTGRIPVNLNVTLERLPGVNGLVARSDFATNLHLDAQTLESQATFHFASLHPQLHGISSAAHSAVDERTGEVFNFAAGDWRNAGRYRIFRINAGGQVDIVAEIQSNPASHVHSLVLTDNFVIIAISPWRVDAAKLLVESALAPSLRFDEQHHTTFFVISRSQNRVVARYVSPAFSSFHYVNAYEDQYTDVLHVDLCRYDRPDVLDQFYLENLRSKPAHWFTPVRPVRYSLPDVRAACKSQNIIRRSVRGRLLSDHRLELPCVAPVAQGRPYRYAYGVSHDRRHGAILSNCILKLDTHTGQSRQWSSPRCCVGEPTFVPADNAIAEDAGVLLVVVVDASRHSSFLIVLDARDLSEISRAYIPQIVPHAFHGTYIDDRKSSPLY